MDKSWKKAAASSSQTDISPATYPGGRLAGVQRTDAALRAAIARRQEGRPTPPEGMEERFMVRLAKERSTGARKPRQRAAIWITAAIAAAAAVAIAVLPMPRKETDTAPGIADVEQHLPASAKETRLSTTEPEPARIINKVSPSPTLARAEFRHRPHRQQPTATEGADKSAKLTEKTQTYALQTPPTEAPPTSAASSSAPAVAAATTSPSSTQPAPNPSAAPAPSVPSVATASQPQPAFTDEERRLMARAEEMRPQAMLYAAELLQCARIEARERQQVLFARQETSDQKQKVINI
ncbi:MAG: hypothetical protein IJ729_07105 [Alloprevotella sp.]|nr:hypothetical protein [Alloprevotella sp.]